MGGGIAKDTKSNAMSNVSLRWMVREVVKADCGVLFDSAALHQWNIPLQETQPSIARSLPEATVNEGATPHQHVNYEERHHSASGTVNIHATSSHCGQVQGAPALAVEEFFEAKDAVKKKVDQLKKNKFWWIIEMIPTYYEWQDEQGQWVGQWR